MTLTAGTCGIDGLEPARVIRPVDAAEAAEAIRAAHDAREAIVLWGGGTRIGVGDAPSRYDSALELRSLSGIVAHSPADLVCTVRAGTTLAELGAALAPSGQRWPVEAPDPEHATVGGTIASAAAAPSRLRFQHPRDWVIGCEAILGDGTRARAGGRVVKNVSGFDLTRLYSGSYGTLAAYVELSLKLVAADDGARTLRLAGADPRVLAGIASRLRSELPLEGIALRTAPQRSELYARVAGGAAAVARMVGELARLGLAEEAADAEWRTLLDAPAREAIVARCAVAPGREAEVAGADGLAFVGTGVAYRFNDSVEQLRTMRERCQAADGALVLERAPADVRRLLGTWGTLRLPSGIASALKARFDPHDVLAPGRVPV